MIADPRRARTSLATLFYGVPFVVIDVRWRVDLVPDVVGLVLFAVAFIGLLGQTPAPEAARWLRAGAIVAVVAVPVSMLADLGAPVHAFWRLSEGALEVAWIVVSCVAMEEFTVAGALPASNEAWRRARLLCSAFVVVGFVTMLLAPFGALTVLFVPLVVVGLVATGAYLIATWRTRAEIGLREAV